MKTQGKRGRPHSIYSEADCKAIADVYDGKSKTLDQLLEEWRAKRQGVNRLNLMAAARRGGYVPEGERKPWSDPAEDQFLLDNWHKMSGDEIAARLGRTFNSVNLRRKRLGIGRYDGEELTIRDLEAQTKIDHRQWQSYIEQGWLKARTRERRKGAAPIKYVSIDAVHEMLKMHPEVYDYKRAPKAVRMQLELNRLPDPPRLKRVVCQSDAWAPTTKPTPVGRQVTHGSAQLVERQHRFKLSSCKASGGTEFWAETYAAPVCPRCGCQVSRYSEKGLFTDLNVGDDEVIDIQARKIGLRWADGRLTNLDGQEIKDADVLRYLFGAGRRTSKSIATFAKLLEAGMAQLGSVPVEGATLLDNILDFELKPDQESALQEWIRNGSLTAAHAMSFGKSMLGLMALTRVPGRHLLVVDTQLNRDQWVDRLRKHAPRVVVRKHYKPMKTVVRVFDREGNRRCTIEIFTYMTRDPLEGPWDVVCCDEVHRLPAAKSHRIALVPSKHRIGLSATADMREDGRGALVAKMTGKLVGEDWTEQMNSGVVKRIPVKVILVEDREHKHEVVGDLLKQHERVAVLCEALEDGRELELRYGIPFIHHATKDKLAVIRSAKSVVMSRVGDAAISMPECQVTVDHSGLFGSRIQSLQRLGRLMHSNCARFHVILMTRVERYERFGKRVEAIRSKGFEVSESVAKRRRAKVHSLLTPALAARVTPKENSLLAALGWRRDELNKAA